MFVPKTAISVTLERDNLVWLRSQTATARRRSVSETLDRIVTDARRSGRVADAAIRSVVGTIDLNPDDPDLAKADRYVREIFDASTGRPARITETRTRARARQGTRG